MRRTGGMGEGLGYLSSSPTAPPQGYLALFPRVTYLRGGDALRVHGADGEGAQLGQGAQQLFPLAAPGDRDRYAAGRVVRGQVRELADLRR